MAKKTVDTLRKPQRGKPSLNRILAAVLSIPALLIASYLVAFAAFEGRIFPGVEIAGIPVGGKRKAEVLALLGERLKEVRDQKIIFTFDKERWEVGQDEIGLEFNLTKTVEQAYAVGRPEDLGQGLREQARAVRYGMDVPLSFSYEQSQVQSLLSKIAETVNREEANPRFALEGRSVKIIAGQVGRQVLERESLVRFEIALGRLEMRVPLIVRFTNPALSESVVEELLPRVEKLAQEPPTFTFEGRRFPFEARELLSLVRVANDRRLDLSEDATRTLLAKKIAPKIEREPINARLELGQERAKIFQAEQEGIKLDYEKNLRLLRAFVRGEAEERTIELAIRRIPPKVRAETINEIGIRERIGRAVTKLTGSPKNRIHNITVGMGIINGILIPPGEEFSMVKTIGNVSEEQGFKPELVIKEDRLIPETGGGLCQNSTTLFRAVLNAGLPVLERRAHAFRVRYYELNAKPGLDATIYLPKPDFRFKNDTPGFVLIQARVEGDEAIVELYGTSDRRTVRIEGPFVSDFRQPGEPIFFEDPELPKGSRVQIEKAVPGAKAVVHYKVFRDGQVIHDETFVSHYVPWRAKFKIGTKEGPTEQPPESS